MDTLLKSNYVGMKVKAKHNLRSDAGWIIPQGSPGTIRDMRDNIDYYSFFVVWEVANTPHMFWVHERNISWK